MKLKLILEELINSVKIHTWHGKEDYIRIFLLTPQHYIEETGTARFIADPSTKEVYAFSDNAMHEQVAVKLGLGENYIGGYIFEAQGKYWSHDFQIRNKPWITKFIGYRKESSPYGIQI